MIQMFFFETSESDSMLISVHYLANPSLAKANVKLCCDCARIGVGSGKLTLYYFDDSPGGGIQKIYDFIFFDLLAILDVLIDF